MSFVELTGSDLTKMVQSRLGGYANALDTDIILDVINEGKDEIWSILKSLNANYFQASTRYDDPTQDNYFGLIVPGEREYALPPDFRAIRFIECVTSGYESVVFVRRSMTSSSWKDSRRSSNESSNANGVSTYVYDIAEQSTGTLLEDAETGRDTTSKKASGGFEIVLAQFPEASLQLVVWYLRALPDLEQDTVLDQIVRPYSKKIANFATEKCMKILQDLNMSAAWLQSWRQDIISVAQGGGQVDQADAQFCEDFQG